VRSQLFYANIYIEGRTDGRTDMTKLLVNFHNFCKTPRSSIQLKFTQALYTAVFIYRQTHTVIVQKERYQYNYQQSTLK